MHSRIFTIGLVTVGLCLGARQARSGQTIKKAVRVKDRSAVRNHNEVVDRSAAIGSILPYKDPEPLKAASEKTTKKNLTVHSGIAKSIRNNAKIEVVQRGVVAQGHGVVGKYRVEGTGGVKLGVEIAGGKGPVVVLVPGLGYSGWFYEKLKQNLAKDHTVIIIDNRGSGASDKPSGRYSVRQMAEDAMAALKNLGVQDDATIVGHSMGTYITQTIEALAQERAPNLVRSKILLNGSRGDEGSDDVPKTTQQAWADATAATKDIKDEKERLLAFVDLTMPLAFPDGWTKENEAEYKQFVKERMAVPTTVGARGLQAEAAARFAGGGLNNEVNGRPAFNSPVIAAQRDEWPPQPKAFKSAPYQNDSYVPPVVLDRPTLVIGSEDDHVVVGSNSQVLGREPNNRAEMFGIGGHNVLLVKPDPVIALIREHLDAVDNSESATGAILQFKNPTKSTSSGSR